MKGSARFVALLRGVNVGGTSLIRMEPLKAAFEDLGFSDVRTVLQSGNVVFSSRAATTGTLERKIREMLKKKFHLDAEVLVLSASELGKAAKANPFKSSKLPASMVALCFLSEAPGKVELQTLREVESGKDEFKCVGRVLYLHCPNGFARTKLSLATIERKLGVHGTARNLNTVMKLCELMEAGKKS